ncbi:enamine deaminase RidA (YjgF/YER057c/UK114 family) [Sphingobium xanthum]|jgi:enamine deaminase RidA (YjgF/YER057c/UK114 family)|uniref:Rid family hydrolase n=1 Tax=Sphingobium xanthum TaxID=1387165 RepID=UPI001C8CB1C6|nr:Rid family hydrolase [Sphingobium xanthum]
MKTERTRIPPLSAFEEEIGFTRALRVGDHIFVAGTVAEMEDGVAMDAGAQADDCFRQIIAHIEELGGNALDVVRVRMFVTDIADADAISAAFTRAMKPTRPVGTLVQVAALYGPTWKCEIEAEAVVTPR